MIGVPRLDLATALLERGRGGPPLLLAGPPGAGKTTLLLEAAESLAGSYLDLMAAASSPRRFVEAALAVVPETTPQLGDLRLLLALGKAREAEAVHALFELWAGFPAPLLLDEATEIRSLAYFEGLRGVHAPFLDALGRRHAATLLATSFPTQARRLWPGVEVLDARPLTAEDLAPVAGTAAPDLAAASFGWPRYVAVLLPRVRADEDLAVAWVDEMASGGRIEALCRHTHEALLLRSRGYGMSKALLDLVAREPGLNLTAIVARLGRSPGAVRDYLGWLMGVDAIRMTRKRYAYVDGMVACWVRLHGQGRPPKRDEIEGAAKQVLGREAGAAASKAPRPRHETLMEID